MLWLWVCMIIGAAFGLYVRHFSFYIATKITSSIPRWRFFSWVDGVVAVTSGSLVWLVSRLYPAGASLVWVLGILMVLVFFFVTDLEYQIIPRAVVVPAVFFSAIGPLYFSGFTLNSVSSVLVGGLLGWGVFAAQYYLSKGRLVGGGDQDLGLLLGVSLGSTGIMLTLMFAYIVGGVVVTILMLLQKISRKTMIPFGVFLIPSGIIILFLGRINFVTLW